MMDPAQHPLYRSLIDLMHVERAKLAPQWKPSRIEPADLQIIKKECTENEFDELNLRNSLYNAFAEGNAHIFAHECEVGRIITLTDAAVDPTPLEMWGRLIRIFGYNNPRPQILWFANRHQRFWPSRGQPLTHAHINGGYCMPCEPNTVVIYRHEDATRVLVHELLHGFCTDGRISPTNSIEQIETRTEAWAELIVAAAREVGIAAPRPLPGALNAQLEWVALQNERLRRDHRVLTAADYAWRYTVGKEAALRAMGFAPHIKKYREVSMRLTPPISPNEAI